MSDTFWVQLFGFLGLGLGLGYQIWLQIRQSAKTAILATNVETATVNAGVAVNKVNAVAHDVAASQQKTENTLSAIVEKVEEVHLATNSMKDELVAVTRKDALAEGKLAGAAAERAS